MTSGDSEETDRRRFLWAIGVGATATLAGCASDDGDDTDDEEEDDEPTPQAVSVDADATWRTQPLTDATTDEEVRIEAVDGTVIVHTFSTGCAVCHAQHREFAALTETRDDVEIVDITIDPNDDPEELRTYADEEGYDWRFVVAEQSITGSLTADFGQEVTSSSQSPVVIRCPDGEVYRLEKIVDAEDLAAVIDDVC